jgi:hypothetical protein
MWDDFCDVELAELAVLYGLKEEVKFANDKLLANREQIEDMLSYYEHVIFDIGY